MPQADSHRLAAVCYAAVAGYRELAARDESLARSMAGRLRRAAEAECDSRSGRVVDTEDAGVLAVFESADGAVRAAFGMKDAFLGSREARESGVSIRVGLHVGDVVERADGDVRGDAVRAASRIAEIAEPGQVVISSVAHQLLQRRGTVEVQDLGEHELEGVGALRLHAASVTVGDDQTAELTELLREELAPLQVLDAAGFGGMGTIFLVRDPRLRRTLAVKVLREELVADREARGRFLREAQVVAGLAHPNVIGIHSVGELRDGTPYFVMDYVEGGSLADRLEREGPLSVRDARRAVGEVASALAAAHAKGVVHRDIKASNILYDTGTGRCLVTDWGIAALNPATEMAPDTRLTRTGTIVGSPRYMSPEQLAGDEVGPESDIYSLGLLAFELVTGDGPFEGETPRELMIAHLREDAPRLAEVREGVDPELDGAVARCLGKDPHRRITAAELAERFAPGAEAILEWPPPGLGSLHGSLLVFMLFAGVVALMAGAPVVLAVLVRLGAAPDYVESLLAGRTGVALMGLSLVGVYMLSLGIVFLLGGNRRVVVESIDTRNPIRQALTDRMWSLGYGWRILFEVAADRWGDMGRLLSGQREYATVDAERRARIRRRIVFRAAVLTTVLFLLPFLSILAAAAISAGVVTPLWALVLFFIVPAAVWLVALLIRADPSEVRNARHALSRGLGDEVALRAEAEAWQASLARATAGHGPRPGTPTTQRSYWAFQVVSISVLIPISFIFSLIVLLEMSNERALPPLTLQERFGRVVAADVLALEPDGSTAPEQAAALATSMGDAGLDVRTAGVEVASFGTVLSRALAGLAPEEADLLRRLGRDSRGDDFRRLARADGLGPLPPEAYPANALYGDHRIRRFPGLQSVAQNRIAQAALFVDEGDRAAAEEALREVYSVGRLLVVESNDVTEATIGLGIANMAQSALEQLYIGIGRYEEIAGARTLGREAPTTDWREWRLAALAIVRDTTQIRSVRIATMHDMIVAMECRHLSGLLLGLPPALEAELDEVAASLVRTEADRAFIEMATSTPARLRTAATEGRVTDGPEPVVYAGLRILGRLFGNPRYASCPLLATR